MAENKGELTFDDFKKLAGDQKLSPYEKIGFPNSYREGYDQPILNDWIAKIPVIDGQNKLIVDIGSGCSSLVQLFIKHCQHHKHTLVLVDSKEMLNQISDTKGLIKIDGYFPEIPKLFIDYTGKADAVVVYSVLHYIFAEGNIFDFIHQALNLLKPSGSLFLGDIPNISKRSRFIDSPDGEAFRDKSKATLKGATPHENESQKIDDSVLLSILSRYRNFGFETYLLPQAPNLPMANRREDILIIKR